MCSISYILAFTPFTENNRAPDDIPSADEHPIHEESRANWNKMSKQKASGKPEADEVTDPGIEPGIQP